MIVVGRFLLSRLYRIVAATGVREAMTASALLTVVGVALVMEAVGLSAALGAFIAGALLADSEYRHQIEADIAPFEGLLLAVFFIAVGMSIDLGVLASKPGSLIAIVLVLVAVKAAILYLLGRWWGLDSEARAAARARDQSGRRVRLRAVRGRGLGGRDRPAHGQSAYARGDAVDGGDAASASHRRCRRARAEAGASDYEMPPGGDQHVIIAGFGRFGQIVARVLRARHIPFTALDSNVEQVDFVKRFGAQIYYGDAGRLDILRAAAPTRRARSCSPSTMSRPRCGSPRWCARIFPICRSMRGRATARTCIG